MNFKGLSSLNIWLNLISGNLLPMSGNSSFSIFWKMYSAFVWSLLSFCAIMIVSGCFLVPLEQALVEGVLTLVVMAEAVIVVMRIHGQKILVSVDIYTTHFISLITSQYQYIASKLASVFRDGSQQDDSFPENNSRVDTSVEKEIKNLCWQHNNVMSIMKMLKKLISVNVFLVYMSSVLRFCFLGVMLMTMFSSGAFLAAGIVMMYGSGALIQFYILCSAFQKLSEASVEITDEAFHEDWNRFSFSIKRTFLLMKTASSNIVIDLSLFKNFNLSLPSFISIINQAYSISLLLLEMQ